MTLYQEEIAAANNAMAPTPAAPLTIVTVRHMLTEFPMRISWLAAFLEAPHENVSMLIRVGLVHALVQLPPAELSPRASQQAVL